VNFFVLFRYSLKSLTKRHEICCNKASYGLQLTVTAKIRVMKKHKNLPITAVSAHAMKEEKSFARGMNDNITKPIDLNMLIMTWLKPAYSG